MKYSQIPAASLLFGPDGHITTRWVGLQGSVRAAFSRVVNYLFLLNTGGTVASLTYLAAHPSTPAIAVSMWLFIAGIILITIHAAWDYYRCEIRFRRYRSNVTLFLEDKMDWEVLLDRDEQALKGDWIGHALGWASGVAFCVGALVGAMHFA